MEKYNHNIHEGKHTVKITLQRGEYKGHIYDEIHGNCKGGSIIFGFQDYFWYKDGEFDVKNDCNLQEYDRCWLGTLKDKDGNELDFELDCYEMDKMIVAVEIESFEAE